ncbi:MAG: alpha/beta fold hydrolase, partial [Candidatus Thorarchaeota archaeon]
ERISQMKELVGEHVSHVKEVVGEHISRVKSQSFENYTDKLKLAKYEETLRAVDPISMQRDLRACRKFDISDKVKNITIPTFVIVGEDDDIITPDTAVAFEKELPRSDIAVVRGADHIPMIEQPEEFNRLLRKFINWVQENA